MGEGEKKDREKEGVREVDGEKRERKGG